MLIILSVIQYVLNQSGFRATGKEAAHRGGGCKAECMCLETEAVLIKVNPATREERSMQAYWSRPLGCGECLAGKDSLVRSLTLIHWTLIRMALPGLDASVITAFVSRSPPSPNFIFHVFFSFIIVVQLEQFHQARCPICWKKHIHDASESLALLQNCVHFSNLSLFNSVEGKRLARSLIHTNLMHLKNTFTQTQNPGLL